MSSPVEGAVNGPFPDPEALGDLAHAQNRWVLAYALLIERRLRTFRKPHCGSIRVGHRQARHARGLPAHGEARFRYRQAQALLPAALGS
jgi:hypothetical protein